MKKFFTLGIAISLLLLATNIYAQDAQNPWHLIAYENENEVAFYNTEVITSIEKTEQRLSIVLENGKKFSHPLTTTFSFDPRKEGTATTNKSFTATPLNIFYSNGKLHFNKSVNRVIVATINGVLVAQFAGNLLEVPVNLSSGIYIVQADNNSAKLLISNDSGSAIAQQEIKTNNMVYSQPALIDSRSESNIKVYWNIIANNSTTSIKISDVEKFSFMADMLIFKLKNGSTIELSNYQGIEFTIEPTVPTTNINWDLEKTIEIGGGVYGIDTYSDNPLLYEAEFISVVSQTNIIIYNVASEKETKYSRNEIITDRLYMDNSRISFIITELYPSGMPTISYVHSYPDNSSACAFLPILHRDEERGGYMSQVNAYNFNGGTNALSTTFKIDEYGNLVVSYVNVDGITHQHTFKE